MVKHRINFGLSEQMVTWLQSQPAIDGIDSGSNYVTIEHHMTAQQAQTLKTAFMDKLIEPA